MEKIMHKMNAISSLSKRKIFLVVLTFLFFAAGFAQKPVFADFGKDTYDIFGIKGIYGLYQSEIDETATQSALPSSLTLKEEGMLYGGGLFYDRQLTGYFTLGTSIEYTYREIDIVYSQKNVSLNNVIHSKNESVWTLNFLLKYFPIGDFWIGAGPVGYWYYEPEGKKSDLGITAGLGYNWWLTWINSNDFGQKYLTAFIITPEIRISYNLTNRNMSRKQWEALFYLGFGTRAYRPEFY